MSTRWTAGTYTRPTESWSVRRSRCSVFLLSEYRLNVDHYGNTSAASTLILLDEDRRAGRVGEGDLVVFLWIGAGNGAMNGYAAVAL